ncbi:MAG: leucine--tRNA ligase [Planctomycetaceae bacterium]|jgi:leucyl-tRNA synthetase|nr:leucine--tRNA ligase [Planctomycetaceae bacterium]
MKYEPAIIEPKWQKFWEENKTFAVPNRLQPENNPPQAAGAKKLYVLDMFPYPSANGLHVGHPEGYTATDIVARYNRMNGVSVLHPMGWDAFGLPAEQQAKKTGIHPRTITENNINNFRRQLKMLGFSYDWDREVATTDTDYFKWTQYIFLLMYNTWYDPETKKGRPIEELPLPPDVVREGVRAVEQYKEEHRLAYQIEAPVNWCPALGTVLANEEVIGGRSERGNHPVVRMPLRQWMLRITAYADRLESDLGGLDWADGIKLLQKNWIGRSTGAEVDFFIGTRTCSANGPKSWRKSVEQEFEQWKRHRKAAGFPRKQEDNTLRIYTTRPDTLFGATYMVIAPEHPFAERLTTPEQKDAVESYRQLAASKSDLDRTDLAKEKTGVFSGSYALNPVNGEPIPVWIADYVLVSYGTGAIMAVPAHDTRDFEFAKQWDLPILQVVQTIIGERRGVGFEAFTEQGVAVNSGGYDGLFTQPFKEKITGDLSAAGLGKKAVNYKLRDWLFSRQHFWGEPFPLLHDVETGQVIALDPSELPLDMPKDLKFEAEHNTPEPPLEHAPADWLCVERNGKRYKRETNTMPQWAGSCWYYLRYIDPKNPNQLVSPDLEKQWMPVDLYVGGAEHAVLHLLYARFWHKVLYDYGLVSTPEPFQKLVNQGMILGEDGQKMSKSRGNVINPDDVVARHGADSLRLYEMFMGPLESVKPWSTDSVSGVRSFLDRTWRLIVNVNDGTCSVADVEPAPEQNRVLHKTIKAVKNDIENMSFNTAIARMMEFVNFFSKEKVRPRSAMEKFVLILSPFAPHICEELWSILKAGGKFSKTKLAGTLAYEKFPDYDETALVETEVEIPVSVNGKLRSKITVSADSDEEAIESAALADAKIAEQLNGKTVVKKIIVKGKMVNFVVK